MRQYQILRHGKATRLTLREVIIRKLVYLVTNIAAAICFFYLPLALLFWIAK